MEDMCNVHVLFLFLMQKNLTGYKVLEMGLWFSANMWGAIVPLITFSTLLKSAPHEIKY